MTQEEKYEDLKERLIGFVRRYVSNNGGMSLADLQQVLGDVYETLWREAIIFCGPPAA